MASERCPDEPSVGHQRVTMDIGCGGRSQPHDSVSVLLHSSPSAQWNIRTDPGLLHTGRSLVRLRSLRKELLRSLRPGPARVDRVHPNAPRAEFVSQGFDKADDCQPHRVRKHRRSAGCLTVKDWEATMLPPPWLSMCGTTA